ncbi:MAG TPA: N-acetylmuramoyl-L-alanine amidase [Gemmatimonadaceae bacterium]|nr:N-acetylmuramoyl-L-alanine amidase [Gemmatimonadaceae bacterium]
MGVLALLLLAAQTTAGAVGAHDPGLVIRTMNRADTVPLVATVSGPVLRPEELRPLLDIQVRRLAPGSYRVTVRGVPMELETGIATVRLANGVRPMASAPLLIRGQLYVPLQFISEVVPSAVNNLRWDGRAGQLVIFSLASSTARKSARRPAPREAHVVVVDAGHGGPDNGMTGPIGAGDRIYEKDITLAVAKQLGRELQSRGLRVVYTRTTDTLIALSDRGRIANQANGDLFISIHVNAANPHWKDPGAARGFETYFLAEARTEDARRVENMENESVRFETGAPLTEGDPLSYILSDMKQNEHLRESEKLADLIQNQLGTVHPGPSRGVKQAGFRVLVTAFMPAVLVEIGFGTNPAEARFLANPRQQAVIASAIADAAVEYLRRYDRRVNGGAGDGR